MSQIRRRRVASAVAISLLVSEKASLAAELERLEGWRKRRKRYSRKNGAWHRSYEHVRRLRTDAGEATVRIQQSESKEKELAEKCREQAGLSFARWVHILIYSDDRLERAENSLKNTQNRADELEFQLSKLKQAHSTLKTEHDKFDVQLQTLRESEAQWKSKHSSLHEQHSTVQLQLTSTSSEKDALSQEKSSIFAVEREVAADYFRAGREWPAAPTTQNELKAANRRAEDAEQTHLQAEGTTLMRSLDEMRPKIVELTGVKLELGEKVDGLEHTLWSRDSTIGQLEADLDEPRDLKEQADQRLQEVLAQREKDRSLAQASSGKLQKAYADLREELDLSTDSIRSLEAERASHRQESAKRMEEIERLTSASNVQLDVLSPLGQELAERRTDQNEEQDFLVRAQNEIEALRADLAVKDEELERLREAVSSPTRADDPHSLDHELINSLRQQHALDLSAAQSQIRALENSVFDAEAKSHALRKQVGALEDQVAQTRGAAAQRALSPSIPSTSRPASRATSVRTGLGVGAPPLARSVFDQNLTPETRHKRKVSLSMLKARIDSEVAAHALAHQHSHPPSRALSPVQSADGDSRPTTPPARAPAPFHRPQFLDDSHIF
ncbi:hypothetical protein DFH09DRAFT_1490676 [Mycena vulgaris]|nr:hypothetical protein DFH09DRAFT_1490676 [Mycena vulgaris]